MGKTVRLAVLLGRHDTNQVPPSVNDVRTFMQSSQYSIARFWSDTTFGWLEFTAIDIFGWFDVALPPPPDTRINTANVVKAAARTAGTSLEGYDAFVVMLFPGSARSADGAKLVAYDGGSAGQTATVMTTDTHMFVAHELGHVLGFDHTFGIPNTGSDWSDNGKADYSPVYGDPYDIMSAQSFGGSDPSVDVAATFSVPALPGLPNAWIAGPMVSRALLHFTLPQALETIGKVRHVHETGDNPIVTLGRGGNANDVQLLAYHPANERRDGLGRVYIEYRQPSEFAFGTRWDAGLAATGDVRDRAGLVVHVVKPVPDTDTPTIWYAGRIVLPNPDLDLDIDTPTGAVRVTLSEVSAVATAPPWVNIRVDRSEARYALVRAVVADQVTETLIDKREIPGWSFAGAFNWVRRETIRTGKYTPVVTGLGSGGSVDAAQDLDIQWSLNGEPLTNAHGTLISVPPQCDRTVTIGYEIENDTHRLTLVNRPTDGAYAVDILCNIRDADIAQSLATGATFSTPAVEEGWGEDYHRFMRFIDHINHPIPKPKIGPLPIDSRIWTVWERSEVEAMRQQNVAAATVMQELLAEVHRVSGRPTG